MQDEQQPPTLQIVVDEGKKQASQPKKPAQQPQNSGNADADRRKFLDEIKHIRGAVDRLSTQVEKLHAEHLQILDIVRATGAVASGNGKAHADALAKVLEAQTAEREETRKALEYTQRVVTMVAAGPKELERLRKIAAVTDPKAAQLATKGHGKVGYWVAFAVGVLTVIGLVAVVLA